MWSEPSAQVCTRQRTAGLDLVDCPQELRPSDTRSYTTQTHRNIHYIEFFFFLIKRNNLKLRKLTVRVNALVKLGESNQNTPLLLIDLSPACSECNPPLLSHSFH